MKNIPIPSKKLYLKTLIEKVELVIKRMRWKALLFEQEDVPPTENFGFKTRKCPPQHKELANFEEELLNLIQKVSFKNTTNVLQNQLREELSKIRNSSKVYISADKTRNIYDMEKQTYDKLLLENITKTYKKPTQDLYSTINNDAKAIASNLNISDRTECMAKSDAFITIKDHKEDFNINPKCRLINPAKSELGKVSKVIIERINAKVKESTALNQWKNTSDVIRWFECIPDKTNSIFVQFDISEFYPSITKCLLQAAIDFAKQHVSISEKDTEIIMHVRRALLFKNNEAWVKKNGDPSFDVTMGSFDGAEICEMVGLYILHVLSNVYGSNTLGLYRDDGLACFNNVSGPESDRIRKNIISIFKERFGLNITISINARLVNFLDVTFDLSTSSYRPFHKPNDSPVYISTMSNHPPSVIKALPISIAKRISNISSNKDIFSSAAPYYNNALSRSGYKEKMVYQENGAKSTNNRQRKIIWFNPPYSMNVRTNIAKSFLLLIDKHFPKNSKLSKVFNRNNVKVSYSCMPNMASIVTSHNKNILRNKEQQATRSCNCRIKASCPLDGNCQQKNVIYRCNVKSSNQDTEANYIGLTENSFKDRYYKHQHSFKHASKINTTELSKLVWKLKEEGKEIEMNWSIVGHSTPYCNGSGRCNLCLTEKLHVITSPFKIINKRTELISKCRHENKYYLYNFKAVPPDI